MSVVRNQTTQLKTEWKIWTDALANKIYRWHPKRCATKLDIREMQIKIILWCYYTTVRSSRIKKNKTSEDEGQLEL